MRRAAARALALVALLGAAPSSAMDLSGGPMPIAVTDEGVELGTTYSVVVIAASSANRSRAQADLADVRVLVQSLAHDLSEWRTDSEISRVNREAAAGPVTVAPTFIQLLRGSLHVAAVTHGAFDVTWKPLGILWEEAAKANAMPDSSAVAAARSHVGSAKLEIGGTSVRFLDPAMQIGLGGVATGWIVDAAYHALRDRGYRDVNVNIGGDLRVSGRDETGAPWRILIADPFAPDRAAAILEIEEASVTTSGNSIRKLEVAGTAVGHIIDPRTGYPPPWDGAVTVIARDCAMADALATGCFVLGPDAGLALADSLAGVEAVFVTRDSVRSSFRGAPSSGSLRVVRSVDPR